MKTAVLRLYRGDDSASEQAASPVEGEDSAATADPVAPRVLPFPRFSADAGRRRDADEIASARTDGAVEGDRAVTLRFHAAHDDAAASDRGAAADETPDVLPLSAILSPPRFRDGTTAHPELPAGAVAGRIAAGQIAPERTGGWVGTPAGVTIDGPLSRAKILHANRTCKACGAGGVEPVLLSDGVCDASGQQVPGSGTLVGFHCCRCQQEWPVA
ncbi:hypothetical protein [Alienimonas chondri]|uniref:Uncharacterized protein n=1 Tax=Alienimonas chondri TaxID=2681879 RepID=A0ABX1VE39_9PLAN|nr:hypothetical protein [Alienimonas chondri]NNJ26160.1 hypothetical protein [Alienimonas chondri]